MRWLICGSNPGRNSLIFSITSAPALGCIQPFIPEAVRLRTMEVYHHSPYMAQTGTVFPLFAGVLADWYENVLLYLSHRLTCALLNWCADTNSLPAGGATDSHVLDHLSLAILVCRHKQLTCRWCS